jgi:CBS domain-containing protein
MDSLSVGEIMIPLDKYPHVSYSYTLGQAMEVFEQSVLIIGGLKSLPREILVFDEEYNLLGTAGRRDILRGLEPDFLAEKPLEDRMELFSTGMSPKERAPFYEEVIKAAREYKAKPISHVMRPVGATVNYDDHLFKAIYLMNSQRTSLLPVIRDDEVVGVARTVDVFRKVVELLR